MILHACRITPVTVGASGLFLLGSSVWGPLQMLGASGIMWLSYTGSRLAQQPEENLGHRAGAPGFLGK